MENIPLKFRKETFLCRSSLGWNFLFPTDDCLFQGMFLFANAPSLSFTFLNFDPLFELS